MARAAFAELHSGEGQATARLRDGGEVTIRLVTPADEPALTEFLASLCLEARRLRFFTGAANIPLSAHLSAGTGDDRIGLIALDGRGGLVAHALCIQLGSRRAEVAVEVADGLHGRGLGTILIERLAQIAERHGIATFQAEVLPENHAMLEVFRDGFDAEVTMRDGVEHAEFATSAWRLARERFR
jgi:acetate---CoA ligase (ADP-forming)